MQEIGQKSVVKVFKLPITTGIRFFFKHNLPSSGSILPKLQSMHEIKKIQLPIPLLSIVWAHVWHMERTLDGAMLLYAQETEYAIFAKT